MVTTEPPVPIWERVLAPTDGPMPPETACYLLRLDFPAADHARMDELNAKANAGTLTPGERSELDEYVRVGHRLALLQSRARAALRRLAAAGDGHG
jgi:hypothetical protein